MKVVYIAGPYRASTEWKIRENIRTAERAALLVWQCGAAAICPHKNTSFMGGAPGTNDDTWLDGYIEIMLRCDAVYAVGDLLNSEGACAEITRARVQGIPVFYDRISLLEWLRKERG
jgi:hypothetical protein